MVTCCTKPAILVGASGSADEMKKLAIVLALLALAACEEPQADLFPNSPSPVSSTEFPSVTDQPSPTPPAVPERPPATSGASSDGCVDGWRTPEAGTRRATFPIQAIRRAVGIPGDPVVVDMRYFTGPESPPSEKGYILTIERWYVKVFAEQDHTFQGRFLVEAREFGAGVSAVAPYDTRGFRSPDWSGFQWTEADPEPRAYPGLPGEWSGIRYDFVQGGAGLTVRGLPAAVVGCMDGA
jgi:hypothetical protein